MRSLEAVLGLQAPCGPLPDPLSRRYPRQVVRRTAKPTVRARTSGAAIVREIIECGMAAENDRVGVPCQIQQAPRFPAPGTDGGKQLGQVQVY